MKSDKLCMIIPVFNVSQYLWRCIESVINQSYQSFDVFLIDDGSTDGSARICDEIADKYENITAFHKTNSGAGSTRNFGLEKSFGGEYEYIVFVDPDDVLEPAYIEKLIKTIEEDNTDIAICGYRTVLFDGEKIISETVYQDALKGSFRDYAEELCALHKNTLLFGPCNKLFRASMIKRNDVRFGETKRYEDTAFVYRYLEKCNSISFTPEPLYRYSKFLNGRTTAVASFHNELCKGAFIAYDEGYKIVPHMKTLHMNKDAISLFEMRLKEHLETSVCGEMIVSLSASGLPFRERKSYIRRLIQRYQEYFPKFNENEKSTVGRVCRKLANHQWTGLIACMSYLFQIKHKIKTKQRRILQ